MSEVAVATARREPKFDQGICYVDSGAGKPVVLLHGVGMNKEAWAPQIAAFENDYRVIVPDLPGHGGSALLKQDAELLDYIVALRHFLDVLDVSNVSLVGHSMGSLIAIGLALEWDRVTAVVALNAVFNRTPQDSIAVKERAHVIAQKGPTFGVDDVIVRWFGKPVDERHAELCRRVRGWLHAVSWDGYATAYKVFATSDSAFAGRLGELRIPALFITGELDPHSTPAMSRQMADAAPYGQAVVIEGERHLMSLTAPARVNKAISSFLAEPAAMT